MSALSAPVVAVAGLIAILIPEPVQYRYYGCLHREVPTGDMRSFKTHFDEYVRNGVVQLCTFTVYL